MSDFTTTAPLPTHFSLRPGEPPGAELQRIAGEQVDLACWHLGRPEIGPVDVHEARKACKRIRAVVRLVRDDLPAGVYGSVNADVRDVARAVSPVRSASMVALTVRGVAEAMGWPDGAVAGWALLFDAEAAAALADLSGAPGRRDFLIAELRDAAEQFGRWTPGPAFSPTRAGLRRVYRRGRAALAAAYADPADERFHDWRKRVKYLQYQLEILAGGEAGPVLDLADVAGGLSEELGMEHDLSDLGAALEARGDVPGNAIDVGVAIAATRRLREARREAMLPQAQRLYAMKPKRLLRWIEDERAAPAGVQASDTAG